MAKIFNQIRKPNAILKSKSFTTYGKQWAVSDNCDGWSIADITVPSVPSDIADFLVGDTTRTTYAIGSNVASLCNTALSVFPNLENLYLFSQSQVSFSDTLLSTYNTLITSIYVPDNLIASYKSSHTTYQSLFKGIVQDYTLTIPYVGETTLTSAYVDMVISGLSSAEKTAITKLVIPTGFTSASADSIAWGYDFSALTNLNNNVWYGATKYDFTTFTISGSGTLTSDIVSSALSIVGTNQKALITKLAIGSNFTTYEANCLDTAIDTILPNVNSLEIGFTIYDFNYGTIIYSSLNTIGGKIENIYFDGTDTPSRMNIDSVKKLYAYNATTISNTAGGYIYGSFNSLDLWYSPNVINITGNMSINGRKNTIAIVPKAQNYMSFINPGYEYGIYYYKTLTSLNPTSIAGSQYKNGGRKIYAPKVATFTADTSSNAKISTTPKLFTSISSDVVEGWYSLTNAPSKIVMVMVIDGEQKYINTTDENYSLIYSKLQLAVAGSAELPSRAQDGALALVQDTGHIYEGQNGSWVDIFDGYTATWYSDEDCSSIVNPEQITTTTTAYVKLTANS